MTNHTSSARPRVGVLAASVALLEAERDQLNGELERAAAPARSTSAAVCVGRGHLAGRSAARRGAARETQPKRRTCGWAWELLV